MLYPCLFERYVKIAKQENHDDSNMLQYATNMSVPNSIEGSDKVYLAAFAALTAIYRHNINVSPQEQIHSVVMPAMGSGFGGISFSECARQMAVAYRHYLNPPHRFDWDMVVSREKEIKYDGDKKVIT